MATHLKNPRRPRVEVTIRPDEPSRWLTLVLDIWSCENLTLIWIDRLHQMETFTALLTLCAGNSPVTGEFPSQRPMTRSFALRLNKGLSKQSWRRWFETPSLSLWRHCYVLDRPRGLLNQFRYGDSETIAQGFPENWVVLMPTLSSLVVPHIVVMQCHQPPPPSSLSLLLTLYQRYSAAGFEHSVKANN